MCAAVLLRCGRLMGRFMIVRYRGQILRDPSACDIDFDKNLSSSRPRTQSKHLIDLQQETTLSTTNCAQAFAVLDNALRMIGRYVHSKTQFGARYETQHAKTTCINHQHGCKAFPTETATESLLAVCSPVVSSSCARYGHDHQNSSDFSQAKLFATTTLSIDLTTDDGGM